MAEAPARSGTKTVARGRPNVVSKSFRSAWNRRFHQPPSRDPIGEILSLIQLGPLLDRFMPWSGSSIAPSVAVRICNELELNARREILEFGPGLSTLVMASWAQHTTTPIHIVAVEENPDWCLELQRRLKSYSYATVDFLPSPLDPYREQTPLPVARWYRWKGLEVDDEIQLAIVDGPTAYEPQWACDRYPAIRVLQSRLAANSAILLDDTHRAGEAAVARAWQSELGESWRVHRDPASTWFVRGEAWNTR